MKLQGKVETGYGKAQQFLDKKPYKEKIKQEIGFKPFPGTLNLEVRPEKLEKIMENSRKERVESFEHRGEKQGGLDLYPGQFEGLEVAIVDPDRSLHGMGTAEILASVKLREKLGLEDGDEVEIQFPR
ncbi:MAG: DUF120 domain-containing protein [Candidatus Nanohalobium sp.]